MKLHLGFLVFQLSPADAWQPFTGGGQAEYRSTKAALELTQFR